MSYKLPTEIWMNVFHHIDSTSQLAQCRLVCKQWDHPAEIAMLGTDILIHDRVTAEKMGRFLINKPEKAHHIRSLTFATDYLAVNMWAKDLIKVAFTTNMEHLTFGPNGMAAIDEFFDALIEAAENSPTKNFKLKSLPRTLELDGLFSDAVYSFKDSLQSLEISLDCVLSNLFLEGLMVMKKLRQLKLSACYSIDTLVDLNSVLKNCPYLSSLELRCLGTDHDAHAMQESEVFWSWIASENVQKVETLNELIIDACSPGWTQYLIYKYPNIKQFTSLCDEYHGQSFVQTLNALKTIPLFKATLHSDDYQGLSTVCSHIMDEMRGEEDFTISAGFANDGHNFINPRIKMAISLTNNDTSHQMDIQVALQDGLSNQVRKSFVNWFERLLVESDPI